MSDSEMEMSVMMNGKGLHLNGSAKSFNKYVESDSEKAMGKHDSDLDELPELGDSKTRQRIRKMISEELRKEAPATSSTALELRNEVDRLKQENATLRKTTAMKGNPAVVGLAGFGGTTLTLQYINCGWMSSPGPVLALAFFYGGLAQLIAGLMEFGTGNNLCFSAFTTYGCFWISLGVVFMFNNFQVYAAGEKELAFFFITFSIITFIYLVVSTRTNLVLFAIFFLLDIGLILLIVANFNDNVKLPLAYAHVLTVIAGYVLLVCALCAWYILAHILLEEHFGRDILPVGPPLYKLFERNYWRSVHERFGYEA